jgi:hypothetical protein
MKRSCRDCNRETALDLHKWGSVSNRHRCSKSCDDAFVADAQKLKQEPEARCV